MKTPDFKNHQGLHNGTPLTKHKLVLCQSYFNAAASREAEFGGTLVQKAECL